MLHLNPFRLTISGADFSHFQLQSGQDNCTGQTLSPSQSCEFRVEPISNSNKPVSAVLSATDGSISTSGVVLTGTMSGFALGLSLTPSTVTNTDITGGSSPGSAVVMTLENTGSVTSGTLTLPSFYGDSPGNYEIVPGQDNCTGNTLAASNSCTFEIRPIASASESYSAYLIVGDGTITSSSSNLSGSASGFAPAALTLSPSTNTNMDITGGSSPGSAVTLTLQNTGGSTSGTLTTPTIGGTNPGNFEIVPGQDNCTGNTFKSFIELHLSSSSHCL